MFSSAINIDFITFISVCLAVLLINKKEDIEFVEHWIGILGVLASCYGFLYFMCNDVAYLGTIYADTEFAGKGVLGSEGVFAWLRWVPIDKEPNFWAAILLIPFGYWLSQVSRKITVGTMLGLSITLLGILFSYSRSTFIIALLILIFVLFFNKKESFFYVLFGVVLVFFGAFKYSPDLVERILSISENVKTEGGSGRFELWGEAIRNFSLNPILGVGTGQTVAYSSMRLGTHNLFLQILGENGLIGFSIFVFIWFSAFDRMRMVKTKNSFYYYAFLGYSINLMTIHNFDLRIPFFVILLFYCYYQSSITDGVQYGNMENINDVDCSRNFQLNT